MDGNAGNANHDPILVVFRKEQVRQRKIGHFLKTFGPETLTMMTLCLLPNLRSYCFCFATNALHAQHPAVDTPL